MTEKCTKYEALFTFGNEETLKSHIESCEDCRHEQEIMDKVSDLLKEVKPYYKTKRQNVLKLKMATSLFETNSHASSTHPSILFHHLTLLLRNQVELFLFLKI